MRRKRRPLPSAKLTSALLAAALAFGVVSTTAHAQSDAALKEARVFFDAGAKAYAAGQYPAAIQAFEQAYAIVPREGILFSIGQAHRKQYYRGRDPGDLRRAIEHYRKYLDKAPGGKRAGDATSALAELEPMLDRLTPTTDGETPPPPPPSSPDKEGTRLMISSSTPGAKVSVDGGAPQSLSVPHIADVKPGKHAFRVFSDGYVEEKREVTVVAGTLLPQDVALDEQPATLQFDGDEGADVSIDGRFVGRTPLAAPLDVPPGSRFIAVTKSGYDPHSEEIDLTRGANATVTVDLDSTTQRTVSYVFFAGGAVFILGSAVAAAFAFNEQSQAQELDVLRNEKGLTSEQRQEYEDHRDARDQFRAGAAFSAGFGGVLALVGGVLYLFDSPGAVAPPASRGEPEKKPDETPPASDDMEMEVSAVPVLGPTFVGAGVTLTF